MNTFLAILVTLLLGIFMPLALRLLHAAIKDFAILVMGHQRQTARMIVGSLIMIIDHSILLIAWALVLGCCMDIWSSILPNNWVYLLVILLAMLVFILTEMLFIFQMTKQEIESGKHRHSSRHKVLSGMQTEMGIVAGLIIVGMILLHLFPALYTWGRGLWQWIL